MSYELQTHKHHFLITLTKEVMIQMNWTPDHAYYQVSKLVFRLAEAYGPILDPDGGILPRRICLVHEEVYRTIFRRPYPAAVE